MTLTKREARVRRAQLAEELGFYPADLDEESVVRYREQNARYDRSIAEYEREYSPGGPRSGWSAQFR